MVNLKKIPQLPGVYLYYNAQKQVIYVGKAINLKKRISQYFRSSQKLPAKTAKLVSEITDIKTITLDSELAALILEASLIKQYLPKYNSLLKDDRSYLYIAISKDKLPLVYPTYKSTLTGNEIAYGPFPNALLVKRLLRNIRRIFPYYSKKHPLKKCLYCHLGICPGPNPDLKKYRRNISKIKKILEGRFQSLLKNLQKDMTKASRSQQYELALSLRNQLNAFQYISSGWQAVSNLSADFILPQDNLDQAANELKSVLSKYFSISTINRIECYDISHFGNKYFVGAMTVWSRGVIDHSQYRHFKIPLHQNPNDQLMIKEVIFRRLKNSWPKPDLILVDGGKPQVSAACSVSLYPVVGLAKKQETLILSDHEKFVEINLPRESAALKLLQNLRDEAHRFSNRYRKKLASLALSQ